MIYQGNNIHQIATRLENYILAPKTVRINRDINELTVLADKYTIHLPIINLDETNRECSIYFDDALDQSPARMDIRELLKLLDATQGELDYIMFGMKKSTKKEVN